MTHEQTPRTETAGGKEETQQVTIGICSREDIPNHEFGDYSHMLSLIDPDRKEVEIHIPSNVEEHRKIAFHDIDDIEARAPKYAGCIHPSHRHVIEIFQAFEDLHQGGSGIIVHCEAGISRSTAASILGLCRIGIPPEDAFDLASELSPLGLPNRRILRLGSEILGLGNTLNEMAEEQRRYLFEIYNQPDPIAELEKEMNKTRTFELKLRWWKAYFEDRFLSVPKGALEKTVERWTTRVKMESKRRNLPPGGEPPKETLKPFFEGIQNPT